MIKSRTLQELEWEVAENRQTFNRCKEYTIAFLSVLVFWAVLFGAIQWADSAEIVENKAISGQIQGNSDDIQEAYDQLKKEGFDVAIVPPMKYVPLTQEQRVALNKLKEEVVK